MGFLANTLTPNELMDGLGKLAVNDRTKTG